MNQTFLSAFRSLDFQKEVPGRQKAQDKQIALESTISSMGEEGRLAYTLIDIMSDPVKLDVNLDLFNNPILISKCLTICFEHYIKEINGIYVYTGRSDVIDKTFGSKIGISKDELEEYTQKFNSGEETLLQRLKTMFFNEGTEYEEFSSCVLSKSNEIIEELTKVVDQLFPIYTREGYTRQFFSSETKVYFFLLLKKFAPEIVEEMYEDLPDTELIDDEYPTEIVKFLESLIKKLENKELYHEVLYILFVCGIHIIDPSTFNLWVPELRREDEFPIEYILNWLTFCRRGIYTSKFQSSLSQEEERRMTDLFYFYISRYDPEIIDIIHSEDFNILRSISFIPNYLMELIEGKKRIQIENFEDAMHTELRKYTEMEVPEPEDNSQYRLNINGLDDIRVTEDFLKALLFLGDDTLPKMFLKSALEFPQVEDEITTIVNDERVLNPMFKTNIVETLLPKVYPKSFTVFCCAEDPPIVIYNAVLASFREQCQKVDESCLQVCETPEGKETLYNIIIDTIKTPEKFDGYFKPFLQEIFNTFGVPLYYFKDIGKYTKDLSPEMVISFLNLMTIEYHDIRFRGVDFKPDIETYYFPQQISVDNYADKKVGLATFSLFYYLLDSIPLFHLVTVGNVGDNPMPFGNISITPIAQLLKNKNYTITFSQGVETIYVADSSIDLKQAVLEKYNVNLPPDCVVFSPLDRIKTEGITLFRDLNRKLISDNRPLIFYVSDSNRYHTNIVHGFGTSQRSYSMLRIGRFDPNIPYSLPGEIVSSPMFGTIIPLGRRVEDPPSPHKPGIFKVRPILPRKPEPPKEATFVVKKRQPDRKIQLSGFSDDQEVGSTSLIPEQRKKF